jgi:hypothetical protein
MFEVRVDGSRGLVGGGVKNFGCLRWKGLRSDDYCVLLLLLSYETLRLLFCDCVSRSGCDGVQPKPPTLRFMKADSPKESEKSYTIFGSIAAPTRKTSSTLHDSAGLECHKSEYVRCYVCLSILGRL